MTPAAAETLRTLAAAIHNDHKRAWQSPFLFARAIRATNTRHGTDYSVQDAHEIITAWCAERGIDDVDNFIDMVALKIDKVRNGGLNAIDAAHQAARASMSTLLPGKWPTPRIHADCSLLNEIGLHLSAGGRKTFFLSCRDAARLLNTNKNRAAELLRLLCTRGYFQPINKAAHRHAQEYTFNTKNCTQTHIHTDTQSDRRP